MTIPECYGFCPRFEHRFAILVEPRQYFLLSKLRDNLLNAIIQRNQSFLNDLQSSNSSQEFSLRSEQEHSIVFDIRRAVFERGLAGGVAV